jgi:hypothetical protein
LALNGYCGALPLSGELNIDGEVQTVCPVARAAASPEASLLVRMVTPLSTLGVLGDVRDVDLPPRWRHLKMLARGWRDVVTASQQRKEA